MRVLITQTWQANGFALARFDVGQVFDVSAHMAIYLFAMHCAEPASGAANLVRVAT